MKKLFFFIATTLIILNFSYAQLADESPLKNPAVSSSLTAPLSIEVQYQFNTYDNSGEAGCESDGEFIYTALWNSSGFIKYSLAGDYIETFQITGVSAIRDLAYDGEYFYGSNASTTVYILDFTNETLIGTFTAPGSVRAIAYNDDLDAFYANNWSSDIILFDKLGNELNRFSVGTYGSYYGLAYDNFTDNGPFLWGYSQDGSDNMLVQIQLPSGNETGIVYDIEDIFGIADGLTAGGLFIQPNIVDGTVSIVGNIQNNTIWVLKLTDYKTVPVSFGLIASVFAFLLIGILFRHKLFRLQ
ncbi:MAG: hypothetical protein PF436_04780 [Prolixibacteraceae bacterium]|jgi:hypothetical protein|nr:hypothetical protein [Prolixibacteraceae bacterium]